MDAFKLRVGHGGLCQAGDVIPHHECDEIFEQIDDVVGRWRYVASIAWTMVASSNPALSVAHLTRPPFVRHEGAVNGMDGRDVQI
jgi:hypothetical protein